MGQVAAVLMLLFVVGCTTSGGSFCDIAKPIRLSAGQIERLTDAQVKEYLSQNNKGARLCGWRP